MNKHYLDLNREQEQQYWAMMNIYDMWYEGWDLDNPEDWEEQRLRFFDALKTIQDGLGIELFSEPSRISTLDPTYLKEFGNPFVEVVEEDGKTSYLRKIEVIDAYKEKLDALCPFHFPDSENVTYFGQPIIREEIKK